MKKKNSSNKKYLIEVDELKFNDAIMLNYRHELLVMQREMMKEYNNEIKSYYKRHIDFIIGDCDVIAEHIAGHPAGKIRMSWGKGRPRYSTYDSQDSFTKITIVKDGPNNEVKTLEDIINRIGEKWTLKFFLKSEKMAKKFIGEIYANNERRYIRMKKKHPFLLMGGTEDREQMVKILQSSIAENVGLIKSIPKKYHDDILGDVMRTVGQGGNQAELAAQLSKRSNLTRKRIDLIARDQTAKATALIDQQTAIDTGFTKAIWKKSIAGKTHRKDHAAADGTEFDIKKGCLISDEYILPRMKINCKCSYKLVLDLS